jgi:hypothetical protein
VPPWLAEQMPRPWLHGLWPPFAWSGFWYAFWRRAPPHVGVYARVETSWWLAPWLCFSPLILLISHVEHLFLYGICTLLKPLFSLLFLLAFSF